MHRSVTALAVLCLVGCSGAGPYQGTEQINRLKFGDRWPLTVESGELRCEGREGSRLTTIATGGKVYALNSRAEGQELGEPIEPIWAPDPARPGNRMELGPLMDRALMLCVPPSPSPLRLPPPPPTSSADDDASAPPAPAASPS